MAAATPNTSRAPDRKRRGCIPAEAAEAGLFHDINRTSAPYCGRGTMLRAADVAGGILYVRLLESAPTVERWTDERQEADFKSVNAALQGCLARRSLADAGPRQRLYPRAPCRPGML